MIVKLEHPFVFRCFDRNVLLQDCLKLNTFLNRLDKQSAKAPEPDNYKGDGFELFAECLVKLSPVDMRIGILDYKPIPSTNNIDTGVDGIGIGINGNPATVQVKLRTADWILSANQVIMIFLLILKSLKKKMLKDGCQRSIYPQKSILSHPTMI